MREGSVEVDGGRLRYVESGHGSPLIHVRDTGAPGLTPAHELLARRFRVVEFEVPASRPAPPLAAALVTAIDTLGLGTFNLLGAAAAVMTALELALRAPARVASLVLESPPAIPPGHSEADLEQRLGTLATPTLVLSGTGDDAAPALARRCTTLLPNAHLVYVYAAGHAIAADRPEAFAEVVIDFLERHEAFVIRRTATVIHP